MVAHTTCDLVVVPRSVQIVQPIRQPRPLPPHTQPHTQPHTDNAPVCQSLAAGLGSPQRTAVTSVAVAETPLEVDVISGWFPKFVTNVMDVAGRQATRVNTQPPRQQQAARHETH